MVTVKELALRFGYEIVCMPEPDREVSGGYAGDLLSWVMGRAKGGDAWVTIMPNLHIIAVASLADAACIIIADGFQPDENTAQKADVVGVPILTTEKSAYEIAKVLSELTQSAD